MEIATPPLLVGAVKSMYAEFTPILPVTAVGAPGGDDKVVNVTSFPYAVPAAVVV